jgi:FMN reductase (NADPH)
VIQADHYAQQHYVFKTNSDFANEMARSVKLVLKTWNGETIN